MESLKTKISKEINISPDRLHLISQGQEITSENVQDFLQGWSRNEDRYSLVYLSVREPSLSDNNINNIQSEQTKGRNDSCCVM